MAKQMRINELKKLVKSTIREIKSETIRMHENNVSEEERRGVTDRLIIETVKAVLLEAEVEGDDAPSDGSFDPSDKKNHPYDRFLANLFGPALDDVGAEINLQNAKTVIKQFVKKMVPEDDAGAGNSFAQLVTGGDGSPEDKQITLKEDQSAGPASGLRPSQLEVFLPQSIDGYLTRGVDFTKDIMAGSYDSKNSIFFSEEGYIIDGHHRCSSINGLNPACTVTGVMMTAKIETCLKLLNLILEAYENGNAKVASGDPSKSIWNNAPTPESVKQTLLEVTQRTGEYPPHGPWSAAENDGDPEKALQTFVNAMKDLGHPSAGDVDKFCESVASNYAGWAAPEKKFGKREQMPQLEDKLSDDSNIPEKDRKLVYSDYIKPGLEAGEFDYARGHNYNESVDLARWSKLAGILKD